MQFFDRRCDNPPQIAVFGVQQRWAVVMERIQVAKDRVAAAVPLQKRYVSTR